MKLHLGCGRKHLAGYTNVDIRLDVDPDIVADVRHLGVIDSDTVEEIYFCHGIEHLPYNDVPAALMEWRRILVPGGVLRLSVPDFRKVLQLYGKRGLDPQVRAILCGGQEYHSNIHYSVWDSDLLIEMLRKAGYTGIRVYDPLGLSPAIRDYSILKVDGIFISLNVEAIA